MTTESDDQTDIYLNKNMCCLSSILGTSSMTGPGANIYTEKLTKVDYYLIYILFFHT